VCVCVCVCECVCACVCVRACVCVSIRKSSQRKCEAMPSQRSYSRHRLIFALVRLPPALLGSLPSPPISTLTRLPPFPLLTPYCLLPPAHSLCITRRCIFLYQAATTPKRSSRRSMPCQSRPPEARKMLSFERASQPICPQNALNLPARTHAPAGTLTRASQLTHSRRGARRHSHTHALTQDLPVSQPLCNSFFVLFCVPAYFSIVPLSTERPPSTELLEPRSPGEGESLAETAVEAQRAESKSAAESARDKSEMRLVRRISLSAVDGEKDSRERHLRHQPPTREGQRHF